VFLNNPQGFMGLDRIGEHKRTSAFAEKNDTDSSEFGPVAVSKVETNQPIIARLAGRPFGDGAVLGQKTQNFTRIRRKLFFGPACAVGADPVRYRHISDPVAP